jgi:hypothetical protein
MKLDNKNCVDIVNRVKSNLCTKYMDVFTVTISQANIRFNFAYKDK